MRGEKVRIGLQATPTLGGEYEITAITAGTGNGWEFSADCLRESVALWEGVECFVDHAPRSRSIKDLAGVLHSAAFSEEQQGITARLKPAGPAAGILSELAAVMLGEGVKPSVGFSADILFTARGKRVQKILRVFSVDLVIDPARGGAFLRALLSKFYSQEAGTMTDGLNETKGSTAERAQHETETARSMPDAQQQPAKWAEELEQARQVRLQMSEYLLSAALQAAHLPAPMADHLRARFAGREFEAAELSSAIDEARKLVAELTSSRVVQGARLGQMVTAEEQLQAAVDDLLGAPRDAGQEHVQPHRLSGIRELYHGLTGDLDLHGGYYPQRARFATTADFTGLVKNALNKLVVQKWKQLGEAGYTWWERIVQVEHFNTLNQVTGTLVGTVGSLPLVAEGAEYTELAIGDSPETGTFYKYGGYIPLTLELIDRDESRKLRSYPVELAAAGLRKISSLVAAIFTDNAGVGPTMADNAALFNATAVTTPGGHANLLTTALSAAQWEVVSTAVYNQPLLVKNAAGYYGTGPKMAVNPRYLLVPRPLQLTAMKILYPALENATNITSENLQRGQPGDVITVPEWTDATDWAAVVDPRIAPAIFIGERFGLMPEIYIANNELSPAVFMNDEHRLKVRHFLAVWVNDFRPLHKSNVAG